MEWFYVDQNQERQSFDETALGDLVKGETLSRDTLLWNETMTDWQAAGLLFPAWFPGESSPATPVPVPPVETPPTSSARPWHLRCSKIGTTFSKTKRKSIGNKGNGRGRKPRGEDASKSDRKPSDDGVSRSERKPRG